MKRLFLALSSLIVAFFFWTIFAMAINGMVEEWQIEAAKQQSIEKSEQVPL